MRLRCYFLSRGREGGRKSGRVREAASETGRDTHSAHTLDTPSLSCYARPPLAPSCCHFPVQALKSSLTLPFVSRFLDIPIEVDWLYNDPSTKKLVVAAYQVSRVTIVDVSTPATPTLFSSLQVMIFFLLICVARPVSLHCARFSRARSPTHTHTLTTELVGTHKLAPPPRHTQDNTNFAQIISAKPFGDFIFTCGQSVDTVAVVNAKDPANM